MLADDMAVPPSQIPKAVAGIWDISEKYDIIIPPYGHSGDGNLHTKVLMMPAEPEHWKQAQKAVKEVYELIHSLGGTTTGEHGIGITKASDFHRERKAMIPMMKTIKKALDPNNIMNPHKIDQWTEGFVHELRYPTNPKRKLTGHLAKWEEQMMMCTMCGYCKNVCPTFVSLLWDPPSSRGRVIMSYGMLEGELEPDDSVVSALYQCTLCRDCNRRCPSKVEVPDIVRAARADLVEKCLAYDGHKTFIENIKNDAPFYRRLGLQTINRLVGTAANSVVKDTQSGYRAYSAKILPTLIKTNVENYNAETIHTSLLADNGYNVTEVPTFIRYQGLAKTSHKNPLTHGIQLILMVISL